MDAEKYKVVCNGRIAEGQNIDEVKQNIANLFKVTVDKVEKYFTGEETVVKNNVDYSIAVKFKNAFEKNGAVCELIPVITDESGKLTVMSESEVQELEKESIKDITEHRRSSLSAQVVIMSTLVIIVRLAWSLTIGLIFFSVGLICFIITDILAPKSDVSFRILTNTYKWGSCHWFKQLKLVTDDYEVEVAKRRKR